MNTFLRTSVSVLALATAIGFGGAAVAGAGDGGIVADPAAVPAPIGARGPGVVEIALETVEKVAKPNDGSTYRYWTFNGQVPGPMLRVRVGETVRIYFGVGGPNKTSSFHVIGEIFDRVYDLGGVKATTEDVQTVTVAPGGATIADITLEVPGTYALVDHALSRLEKGLVGHLKVDGPADPEIFDADHGEKVAARQ